MIKTLIIMTTYGQIFYAKEDFFGAEVGESDISLTAGLISAIYSMTTETQQQKITELELEADRSVFRELPGEKLFIITVDKRMDTSDADDMLTDMVDRFGKKYGDVATDGMILSDFEPIVDEIVADKLWYNTVDRNISVKDLFALLALLIGAVFFPFWFLEGKSNFLEPLQDQLGLGIASSVFYALFLGLGTIIPMLILYYIIRFQSKIGLTFKFAQEYIRRPTRGGYAEMLPSWFLVFPIFSSVLFLSVVRFGRGLQYGLTAQSFTTKLDAIIVGSRGQPVFWYYVYGYVVLYLLTWFLLLPTIIGLATQQLSLDFIKANAVIIGMALIIFLPAQIISGIRFQEAIGFHPQDPALTAVEAPLLPFLFKVKIPINLFLFAFIFFLGVGMAQLIKSHKERYPVGFGLGLFITLAVQNFLFFIIFNSDIFFIPIFRGG